ncbi:MAG: sulfur carrier protein ThiS [Phycisphaerales bacterium]
MTHNLPIMKVTVNGHPHELPEGANVPALLQAIGLAKAVCAVEVNRTLVPRPRHETTALKEGDAVEVVALVGGG